MQNSNTGARTYTLPNRDGTLADNTDLATKLGIAPRRGTFTTTATTPNISTSSDLFVLMNHAVNVTFPAPSGSPSDGQEILIKIKDNGTPRTLTWNAKYVPIGVTLPTTTIANKYLYVICRYDSASTNWHVIDVKQEA